MKHDGFDNVLAHDYKLFLLELHNTGLVGFSFGARMIVSCLKELAQNQSNWGRPH